MINILDVTAGDIVKLKKKHPCGSDQWQVISTGVDFKMQCLKCGRQILMERAMLERKATALIPGNREING